MQIDFENFSALNAFLAVVMVVVATAVGIFKARQISHEHLQSAIDDLHKISESKDARIANLTEEVKQFQSQILLLTEKVGKMQGHTEWLLRRNLTAERYNELLVEALREQNLPVPARESIAP